MDANKDGVISVEEFMDTCRKVIFGRLVSQNETLPPAAPLPNQHASSSKSHCSITVIHARKILQNFITDRNFLLQVEYQHLPLFSTKAKKQYPSKSPGLEIEIVRRWYQVLHNIEQVKRRKGSTGGKDVFSASFSG